MPEIHEVTLHFDDGGVIEAFGEEHIQRVCENFQALFNEGLIQFSLTEDADEDEIISDSRVVRVVRHPSTWRLDAQPRQPLFGGPLVVIAPDRMLNPVTIPF